jgi:hypothetical protein
MTPQDQGAPGHFPTDAVAIWMAAPGSTTLDPVAGHPDSGTIVSLGNIGSFGGRPVDARGEFMDFDGASQPGGPDVSTRGMVVTGTSGGVVKRYYVNVYPALTTTGALGPAAPAGYVRPKAATPFRVSLVPAYLQCTSPDRQHGPPLAFGSCSNPRAASNRLTVGTPDANGRPANSEGSVTYRVVAGDVSINAAITDVREAVTLGDYSGELSAVHIAQITDSANGTSRDEPGTVERNPFRYPVPCAATSSAGVGSTCSLTSSFNAVVPGAVVEGKRAVWELGDVEVFDGGADGQAATLGDNSLFERQGVFIP